MTSPHNPMFPNEQRKCLMWWSSEQQGPRQGRWGTNIYVAAVHCGNPCESHAVNKCLCAYLFHPGQGSAC
jgi:hypothetical protein